MKVINWIKENWVLLLLVLIGIGMRLYKLDFQDLWIDEIYSMINTSKSKSLLEIYSILKSTDPHPPLYYWSLSIFKSIFGQNLFVARLFSALIGILGFVALYQLAKELFNKSTALIALALLVVNYFHIYYSQEIRMYSLMFVTVTFSFLYLVRFIKNATVKNLFIYVVASCLMIYTHFFCLIAIISQYCILLYFILNTEAIHQKKQLFYKILIAGIATIILYVPALNIFLETLKMESTWIMLPGPEVLSTMYSEFFGGNELIIWITILGFILYFTKLTRYMVEVPESLDKKYDFALIILLMWIFICLFIPLINSYIKFPVIVNRYFLHLISPILILVAAGLDLIKSRTIKGIILTTFICFSLVNQIFVKEYYSKVSKSEFNKLALDINDSNPQNHIIVTYWGWLMPYFFEDKKTTVLTADLNHYVNLLREGKVGASSFWYMDGNQRNFELTPENQDYLSKNFVLKEELNYFDCWSKHYISGQNIIAEKNLSIHSFNNATYTENAELILFQNGITKSQPIEFDKGNYTFKLNGRSMPETPIKNENAHLIIKKDLNTIADFYLTEKNTGKIYEFNFQVEEDKKVYFELIFDNDAFENQLDRNILIQSIEILKK